MKDDFDSIISRNTLFWLLITNIAVLSPLFDQTTPWSIAICAICFVWRVGIYFGKVSAPPKLLVTSLAIGAATTLGLVASQIGLLNALINLLLLGYALKYIEMRQQRDVKAVVLAGYFIIGLALLDQQSMLNALHLFIVAAINTCVLISVYQDQQNKPSNLGFSLKLLAQSLPLAILMFIVFPRLAPLWMVPNMNNAKTGLSNEMSISDIAKLTRSAELAFRVGFDNIDGSTLGPNNIDLYWRALVLDNFDGITWRQDPAIKHIQSQAYYQKTKNKVPTNTTQMREYAVIAEPSNQKWLFGLDQAYSQDDQVVELPDYRLLSLRRLDQRFTYRVRSYPNNPMDVELSTDIRAINLALPVDLNPQTLALAKQFAQQHPAPKARIDAMMNYFTQHEYFYTLTPPPTGKEQVDDFLFNNKAGFCAHYASALVYLARASGIPARMVTGYQGGEYNPKAGYYSIYQYMAHAWTEVWFEGKGWVRFDPTAMIAPERVLDGFDATFDSETSYLQDSPFSSLRLKDYPWLNELRYQFASLDFYWSMWVLGFDEQRKQQVLAKLLGEVTSSKVALFVLISFIFIALGIAYYAGLLTFKRNADAINHRYDLICHQFAKHDLNRQHGQAPLDFAVYISASLPETKSNLAKDFSRFTALYVSLKYQSLSPSQTQLHKKQYLRLYRKLRAAFWRF